MDARIGRRVEHGGGTDQQSDARGHSEAGAEEEGKGRGEEEGSLKNDPVRNQLVEKRGELL